MALRLLGIAQFHVDKAEGRHDLRVPGFGSISQGPAQAMVASGFALLAEEENLKRLIMLL